MTKKEFIQYLNFSTSKHYNINNVHESSQAKDKFPCIISIGKNIYFGHYDNGKWYKHSFTTVNRYNSGFYIGKQRQFEEEITGVKWFYKI